MRRILRAVNVGRVNSVRLGDALHSLTLTEISLLPFGARSMSVMLQAIVALFKSASGQKQTLFGIVGKVNLARRPRVKDKEKRMARRAQRVALLALGSVQVSILALLSFALVGPLDALAQSEQRVYRIGLLCYLACPNATTKLFTDELVTLGYVPGKNAVFEYRHADGKPERFAQAARELVEQNVDVIFSPATPGTRAAQQATSVVPIVFATGTDPVAMGLVETMEKPGGNLTGVTEEAPDSVSKRVALLKEIVPKAKKFGILWDAASYGDKVTRAMVARTERAVRAAGIEAEIIEVKSPADLEEAFASFNRAGVDGLLLEPTNMIVSEARRMAELAAKNKIPTLWPATLAPIVQGGALIMTGADLTDVFRRAAPYVDKILRGAKPGDLPIGHTQKFLVIINKKTANDLGLAIPQSLLARADRTIE